MSQIPRQTIPPPGQRTLSDAFIGLSAEELRMGIALAAYDLGKQHLAMHPEESEGGGGSSG